VAAGGSGATAVSIRVTSASASLAGAPANRTDDTLEEGEFAQVQLAGLQPQDDELLRERRPTARGQTGRQHVDLHGDAECPRHVVQRFLGGVGRKTRLMEARPSARISSVRSSRGTSTRADSANEWA